MRIVLYFVIFVSLISCEGSESNCAFTVDNLLAYNGNRVFTTKRVDSHPIEFRDKGKDSIEGGYYSFYGNKNLRSYHYFIDMQRSIYSLVYDSIGNLMSEEGNPLIYQTAELKDDSLTIKFYFFILNKIYSKINIVRPDSAVTPLTLYIDTLFSNVGTARYKVYNLKQEQDIEGYINVQYQNWCTDSVKNFKDSFYLHYKPF